MYAFLVLQNTPNSIIEYSIISVLPNGGSRFFTIDRDTGVLSIARTLAEDLSGVDQYVVSIQFMCLLFITLLDEEYCYVLVINVY